MCIMRLVNAAQMREVDRVAIEDWGIPGTVLMENAGAGATRALLSHLPPHPGPIAFFAGPGNNGGDAFVMARHLLNQGYQAITFLTFSPDNARGDAAVNLRILQQMTDDIHLCTSLDTFEKWRPRLQQCSAIVDGLFGTGLTRDLSGWYLTLIKQLNALTQPYKCAIDIPSGLNSDTGHPQPISFRSDLTTTFALPKLGMAMPHAQDAIGKLDIIDIGVPHPILAQSPFEATLQTPEALQTEWPIHPINSHKGTYGHLLVLAGSEGKTGAALLTGQAGLRMGAGLTTLAADPATSQQLQGRVLELMCETIPNTITPQSLNALLDKKSALVAGPGWGQKSDKHTLLQTVLQTFEGPLLLDADALNLLAQQPTLLQQTKCQVILTPHPGEMGRLLQTDTKTIQRDRFSAAKQAAQQYQAIVVLKGANTIIATPQGEAWINSTGHPGLATAGSGDVLSGMIGALLARKWEPTLAARAGVCIHGMVADSLLPTHGKSSLIASDILHAIPNVMAQWEDQ
jgi:NAD(P)H-hydrate epimerase